MQQKSLLIFTQINFKIEQLNSHNTYLSFHIHQNIQELLKHENWKCVCLFGREQLNLFCRRKRRPKASHHRNN